ncbi:MAG: hypothetical protein WBB08_08535 [Halobacteriota archaeon]
MVHGRVQSEKAGIIEGIIDVGIVVLAHFENPARIHAFNFLKPILLWKRKCLSLAKNHGAVIIYSIDGELAKRVKDVEVINPIPGDVMRKYHDFVAGIRE